MMSQLSLVVNSHTKGATIIALIAMLTHYHYIQP